jgi:hypothetical protein
MTPLTDWERRLLDQFVELCLGDDPCLRRQIDVASVHERELFPSNAYITLGVPSTSEPARVADGPYQLEGFDLDETPIGFMLFLDNGRLAAIEYIRADSEAIESIPDPAALRAAQTKRI